MKTLFSVLVLLLVFLLVPGENAISNDRPYVPPPDGVNGGGDDHPWGGEDPGGEGISGRGVLPRTVFGIPAIDLIYNTLKYHDFFDAHPRKTQHSRIIRIEASRSTYAAPIQGRNTSQNRSGRVGK
jgi:hypothetical protein